MKVTEIDIQNNLDIKHRKEKNFYKEFAILVDQGPVLGIRDLLILRCYGTKARNYVCFWIQDSKHGIWGHGPGMADGYGWDRESGAAQGAIESIGITLSDSIEGRGEYAIQEALRAIARELGYRKLIEHVAHA